VNSTLQLTQTLLMQSVKSTVYLVKERVHLLHYIAYSKIYLTSNYWMVWYKSTYHYHWFNVHFHACMCWDGSLISLPFNPVLCPLCTEVQRNRSCRMHSFHVFFLLPLLSGPAISKLLQVDTQSSLPFHSRCPNHLSRPYLTNIS